MLDINRELYLYARKLYISNDSEESKNINRSILNICRNLKRYFLGNISRVELFGSFTRKTILPRQFDLKSDIDILILFNQEIYQRMAETYRTNLLLFADKYYQKSSIKKDFPTVVVELNHIKFDLVPAKAERFYGPPTISIPDSLNKWQETNPNGFNQKLSTVNQRHSSKVKPLIRLLKYWNASHGYPYNSFALEQEIVEMLFQGNNLHDYFFFAIDNLDIWWTSNKIETAVQALSENAKKVLYYLEQNDKTSAMSWLQHILPM